MKYEIRVFVKEDLLSNYFNIVFVLNSIDR